MKRYYFTWYNHIAQQDQTDFVIAENETQARQMAILIMRLFAGSMYDEDAIETLNEMSDGYYYTMDELKKRYEKCGKEFILPEIKDYEDDEDEE